MTSMQNPESMLAETSDTAPNCRVPAQLSSPASLQARNREDASKLQVSSVTSLGLRRTCGKICLSSGCCGRRFLVTKIQLL